MIVDYICNSYEVWLNFSFTLDLWSAFQLWANSLFMWCSHNLHVSQDLVSLRDIESMQFGSQPVLWVLIRISIIGYNLWKDSLERIEVSFSLSAIFEHAFRSGSLKNLYFPEAYSWLAVILSRFNFPFAVLAILT